MGRPLIPIDAEQVYKLARLGCTQEEIADVLGVSQQTISGRFSVECARARASLKSSLRRAQIRRAIKDRSDTMLVHLGKVYLGQRGASEGESGDQESVIFERVDNPRDAGAPPVLPSAEATGVREE